MAYLERSTNLLTLLRERIDPGDGQLPDPLIQSVVVNYLLTTIYADIESGIHTILVEFGRSGASAGRVHAFIKASVKRIVRSVTCSELAGVLGMFEMDCKKHFQAAVNDTQAQLAYDRIVAGRHQQAHRLGSDFTIADLSDDTMLCEHILIEFGNALNCSCPH